MRVRVRGCEERRLGKVMLLVSWLGAIIHPPRNALALLFPPPRLTAQGGGSRAVVYSPDKTASAGFILVRASLGVYGRTRPRKGAQFRNIFEFKMITIIAARY